MSKSMMKVISSFEPIYVPKNISEKELYLIEESKNRWDAFKKKHKVTHFTYQSNWARLSPELTRKKFTHVGPFPHCEEPVLFECEPKKRILIAQPDISTVYDEIKGINEVTEDVTAWCKQRGLTCEVSMEKSFRIPNKTLLIEVTISDLERLLNYVENNSVIAKEWKRRGAPILDLDWAGVDYAKEIEKLRKRGETRMMEKYGTDLDALPPTEEQIEQIATLLEKNASDITEVPKTRAMADKLILLLLSTEGK